MPDEIAFRYCIEKVLATDIRSRTTRSLVRKLSKDSFLIRAQPKFTSLLNQVVDSIIMIDKKIPITGKLIDKQIELPPSLLLNAKIDFVYSRKGGPCYGIILPIFHDNLLLEHISSHLAVCSTVICDDVATNEGAIKYIDILIPSISREKRCLRYLIRLAEDSQRYIDFCHSSIINAARRYYIEEEHVSNWSDKCVWCPQAGRCKIFRDNRQLLRQNIKRN